MLLLIFLTIIANLIINGTDFYRYTAKVVLSNYFFLSLSPVYLYGLQFIVNKFGFVKNYASYVLTFTSLALFLILIYIQVFAGLFDF